MAVQRMDVAIDVGLDGVRSEIAMMRTPDGHSKLELTKYHQPAAEARLPLGRQVRGVGRATFDPWRESAHGAHVAAIAG